MVPGGGQFALNEPVKGTLYLLATLAAPFLGYALGTLLTSAITPNDSRAAVVIPINFPLLFAIGLPLISWETALLDAVITDMRRAVPQTIPDFERYAGRSTNSGTIQGNSPQTWFPLPGRGAFLPLSWQVEGSGQVGVIGRHPNGAQSRADRFYAHCDD